ncbi:alpha/beta hydrolase [Gorillibacterium massiliense]|uniref:alpha/beta hydrolase n=1 Tax=Gorillibacterium massiliense TaxID=1280390 RepID=UPI0004B05623|nr:alpha/beta hydrolase [Gorillibacterium massiliense]
METTHPDKLAAIKTVLRQNNQYEQMTVDQIRETLAKQSASIAPIPGVMTKELEDDGVNGEWLWSAELGADHRLVKQVLLYYHGGGFIAGTSRDYRDLASRLALTSGVKVLTADYRLAPEHPYPAANEDALSAYRWLLNQGYAPENIVLGGDSIGASLALMTLLALRDNGEPLPAGAFLLSPHSDLVHLDGESYKSNAALDPTGSLEGNRRILDAYLREQAADEPYPAVLSPLRQDLNGLPPLLIQVGDQEVLLSDATRLAERAQEAGVAVTLEVWEEMWCVFQMLASFLPEARQALENVGKFTCKMLCKQ